MYKEILSNKLLIAMFSLLVFSGSCQAQAVDECKKSCEDNSVQQVKNCDVNFEPNLEENILTPEDCQNQEKEKMTACLTTCERKGQLSALKNMPSLKDFKKEAGN